jgi:LacI family transcriptional regulator
VTIIYASLKNNQNVLEGKFCIIQGLCLTQCYPCIHIFKTFGENVLATLKAISQELGLSVTTVSRALNGFPEVSAKTKALVTEAAARLHYRPNQIARKLVTGRSGMVGLITRRPANATSDPSFMEIAMGLSAYLAEHDVDLVFRVGLDDDPVIPYRRLVARNTLDAFILNAPAIDDARISYLRSTDIPFVVHGRDALDADYPFYDIDNRKAAFDAAMLLADLGHQRIAFLNGPKTMAYAVDRDTGFADALSSCGFRTPAQFHFHEQGEESYGYVTALACVSGRYGLRPTAFLCASTLIAQGVLRALKDRNIQVPGQASVIAHDDALPETRPIAPELALTVTRSPLRDACKPLADKVIAILAGENATDLQTTAQAKLIIRHTTGPVPSEEGDPWP